MTTSTNRNYVTAEQITTDEVGNTATPNQIKFIQALQAERVWYSYDPDRRAEENMRLAAESPDAYFAGVAVDICQGLWRNKMFTVKRASGLISALQKAPLKAATAVVLSRDIVPGVYTAETQLTERTTLSRVFKVYTARSGALLVKEVKGSEGNYAFEYMGSARNALPANAVRLTLEQVGSLGRSFGICLECGRLLTDPESIDRGIGPVCAGKYDR